MDEPWQIEISAAEEAGIKDALDQVVIKWLHAGDIRPLAWALTSEAFASWVLATVGLMLSGDPDMPYRPSRQTEITRGLHP